MKELIISIFKRPKNKNYIFTIYYFLFMALYIFLTISSILNIFINYTDTSIISRIVTLIFNLIIIPAFFRFDCFYLYFINKKSKK